ncbi:uncharacterized protein EV420DRAFT_1482126 [Desarmillaria tabescens]|uniref:Uncharacterized protein n=1 Tax=Armillaria tabescens TaxID=1929756 RepID=A0AA39K3S6_ARMTA|nr:uncharacterized protein EV420DRAFT_1482126 [Desarmillaria tabescens]KAK0452831.1 hypothetical protein EV420DRAFT_1482126 [Desarmillaria tabescens]
MPSDNKNVREDAWEERNSPVHYGGIFVASEIIITTIQMTYELITSKKGGPIAKKIPGRKRKEKEQDPPALRKSSQVNGCHSAPQVWAMKGDDVQGHHNKSIDDGEGEKLNGLRNADSYPSNRWSHSVQWRKLLRAETISGIQFSQQTELSEGATYPIFVMASNGQSSQKAPVPVTVRAGKVAEIVGLLRLYLRLWNRGRGRGRGTRNGCEAYREIRPFGQMPPQ